MGMTPRQFRRETNDREYAMFVNYIAQKAAMKEAQERNAKEQRAEAEKAKRQASQQTPSKYTP